MNKFYLIIGLIIVSLVLSGCNYTFYRTTFIQDNFSTYCCSPVCGGRASCDFVCINNYRRSSNDYVQDFNDFRVIKVRSDDTINRCYGG